MSDQDVIEQVAVEHSDIVVQDIRRESPVMDLEPSDYGVWAVASNKDE